MYRTALAMWQRLHANQDLPNTARCMTRLAKCLNALDRPAEALPLFKGALSEYRRIYKDRDEADVAGNLDGMAYCYRLLGKHADALRKWTAALEMSKRLNQGHDHPDVVCCLEAVGTCLSQAGRHAEALPRLQAAAEMSQRLFGHGGHRAAFRSQYQLARCLASLGRRAAGLSAALKSVRGIHTFLTANFPVLTASEKKDLLQRVGPESLGLLHALTFQRESRDGIDGLRGALRLKRLIFEALCHERTTFLARANPAWRKKFKRLHNLRREFATVSLQRRAEEDLPANVRAATEADRRRRLQAAIERLEEEVFRGNLAFVEEARLMRVGYPEVAEAFPRGQALLEYVRYRTGDELDPEPSRVWHYGVYVLVGGTGKVHAIDLGKARPIEEAVGAFHSMLRNQLRVYCTPGISLSPARMKRDEENLARRLADVRRRVFDPASSVVSGSDRLYIAGDGVLELVPFHCLPAEPVGKQPRYLIEGDGPEIICLTTGRDLARLRRSAGLKPTKTVMLIGDPDFDASSETIARTIATMRQSPSRERTGKVGGRSIRDGSIRTMGAPAVPKTVPRNWKRLPLTGSFLERISDLLTDQGGNLTVVSRSGSGAAEEAVLSAARPRILQFATHGFFLEREERDAATNPLLQSMLVLAGANSRANRPRLVQSGDKVLTIEKARSAGLAEEKPAPVAIGDGLLTAYEITSMDLRGTELVNLTACQTGAGVAADSDGITGLRYAFLLAGARSIIMSLWDVPENQTLRQMESFYTEWLRKGQSRYRAFRSAQLSSLDRARKEHGSGHPFLWAGFVYIGDPGDLQPTSESTRR
jgi:CHAT domain-containing protein/tetratricopeptide (TPR) repeat protein